MTAELWLMKPCEHGSLGTCDAVTHGALGRYCEGGLQVRLDPDRVVFKAQVPVWEDVTVEDIIDALIEQETDQ